jgi:hypothetical protein
MTKFMKDKPLRRSQWFCKCCIPESHFEYEVGRYFAWPCPNTLFPMDIRTPKGGDEVFLATEPGFHISYRK